MANVNHTGSLSIDGIGDVGITAAIGSNVTTVTSSNSSKVTLSGTNAYTGATTISAGTLQFGKLASYPNTSTVSVSNTGTTLAVNYGGASDFTNAGVVTLLADTTFGAGTGFALDTTNASGTLSTVIGGAGAPQNLTKLGTNTLTLTGANTYTGVTTLTGGTLTAGVVENAGVSGPFGKPATPAGSIVFNGGGLGWSAANTTDYSPRFAINSGKGYSFNPGGQTVTLATALPVNGVNGLSHTGTGTLILSGANTYTGGTQISGSGILSVSSLNRVVGGGATSNLGAPTTSANGTIFLGGGRDTAGQLTYTGTGETTDRVINVSGDGGGYGTIDQSGSGLLKFIGDATTGVAVTNGYHPLNLQGSGAGEISGVINTTGGSLTKLGTGTWTLSGANTYTGTTTIQNGNLGVNTLKSVGGGSSNLGAPTTVANGTIALGAGYSAGQLTYTGTGETTDRVLNLANTTTGGIIDQSGATGLLKFTSANTATGAGSKTLTLQGSTSGTGEIAGAIVDNSVSNKTSLAKSGTGAWTLSGANTYTGATTVNAGTVLVNGSLAAGSAVTVRSGSTLGGTGTIGGPITVNAGGILAPGAGLGTLNGASMTFASSAILRWEFQAGVGADVMALTGNLTITNDAATTVKVAATGTLTQNNPLFTYGGTLTGANNGDVLNWTVQGAPGAHAKVDPAGGQIILVLGPPNAPSGLSASAVSSSQIDLVWTDNSNNESGFKIERKTGAGGAWGQIDTVGANVTTYNNTTGLSASTEAPPTAAMPTYVAAGAVASGTGTITPALPTGRAVNDILLLCIETANQAVTITNQNGGTWAAVLNSPQGTGTAGGSAATRLTVFWSRYNGTQGNPTVSDSGNHQLGRMIAIRGVTTTGNPWDVTAGGVEATADTSGAIPGATTTVANTFVVAVIATALPDANSTAVFSAWANSNLTSVTERTDNATNAGNGGGLGIAMGGKATAGAYGNTTVTTSSSTTKGMMSIALKPGASGTAPAAPSGLTATAVSSSQINLGWTDNSTNETGFKIERKTWSGGTYAQIATVGAGVTTYPNTGLSASTEYYYRVRAYNTAGNSTYSNEAHATTQAVTPPDPTTVTDQGFNIHITGPDSDWVELAAGGGKFVRGGLEWPGIEQTEGVYDFTVADQMVEALEAHGLWMIWGLWYNNPLYPPATSTEEGRIAYANYAAAMAEHFAGRNVIFEIWNEPNVGFWREGIGEMNSVEFAQEYMALVDETVPAMRAADPTCYILGGAVSCLWPNSFVWLEECLSLGLLESGINVLSVHPYGFGRPEMCIDESQPGASAGQYGYGALRELMAQYGGAAFPVVNSECGYPTGGSVTAEK